MTPTGPEVLARWPRVRADLRTDSTGTLSVNDVDHACAAASVARLRNTTRPARGSSSVTCHGVHACTDRAAT